MPVLLLSGAFETIDEARLAASGANGVIEKPVEPTVVISRVKELLGLKSDEKPATPGRAITPASVPGDKKPPRAAAVDSRDRTEYGSVARSVRAEPPHQPTIRRAARMVTSTLSTTSSIHSINSCRDVRPERRRHVIPSAQSVRLPALPIRDHRGARRR